MLKTITINTETHKVVPIEPTIKMMDGAFDNLTPSAANFPYGVEYHVWDFMLAAAPELNESLWLPIETAPKDGSRIIVGFGRQSGFPVKVVFYNKIHCFWSWYGEPEFGLEKNATHWMPLPPAPEGI